MEKLRPEERIVFSPQSVPPVEPDLLIRVPAQVLQRLGQLALVADVGCGGQGSGPAFELGVIERFGIFGRCGRGEQAQQQDAEPEYESMFFHHG